jgi:predicted AAA+ superfamily ATPase
VEYRHRIVDHELDLLLTGLPAVSLEGAKGVGKTATAGRRAAATLALDSPLSLQAVTADPEIVLTEPTPLLIDEWQLAPPVWDVVRRAVDADRSPGRFLLTGSALPSNQARIHSGAGRIVRLRMRPMTLPERGASHPTVSFEQLLAGGGGPVSGRCDLRLADYTEEIVASGLPGVRADPADIRRRALDSYLEQILDRDIPELGAQVRRPNALRAWLTAYAAATATTTSYTSLLDAATPGEDDKPSSGTAAAYRELLQRIWILDPQPAWIPVFNPLKRLAQSPKHHLADPAMAARLCGATKSSLLHGPPPPAASPRETGLLAALFESLAVLTARVFAQASGATVNHLRTRDGDHEIGIIVERQDHKVLAFEVKLGAAAPADTKHLRWLESQIGDALIDKVVLNTGEFAYRAPDGAAVIPLGLLGP